MVRSTLFVSALLVLVATVSAVPRPADVQNNGVGVGAKDIANNAHVHDVAKDINVAKDIDLRKAVSNNKVKVL
ncbi:hypothetical protein CU098_008530 [Rhizopus stolonifer]|uniref:RxLR effector protein n=1 Tax=Rhizopus stolonifer TaxID=4846 RepID=A0A367KQE6_RHIST|nr:hypothetical protein CU098_008530 [Rhizopus stolonifer]